MFTHDHLRIVDDTATTYAAWIDAARSLNQLGPALRWKSINGKDYLYELNGSTWGTSKGAISAETKTLFDHYQEQRAELDTRLTATQQRLALLSSQYRALGLPRVHPIFGAVCREADLRGMLGRSLLVVGTNAMPAYEIEAQERFLNGLNETQDCDFTWAGAAHFQVAGIATDTPKLKPFFTMVKAVDQMFRVNMERPFQMRNSDGYEVELLLAPSMVAHYPSTESVRPIPMPEQEWLLLGRRISHVVFDTRNQPVRLAVPDPRWMALHKLWLSDKPSRNSSKRPKDRKQGEMLAAAVIAHMPAFLVDEEFHRVVPHELQKYLAAFR